MTTLAQMQEAMLSNILDEDLPLPGHWNKRHAAGLAIYRNNYRSALIDALRSTFERTERLVREESFARAAAHHLIAKPPSSWTLAVSSSSCSLIGPSSIRGSFGSSRAPRCGG